MRKPSILTLLSKNRKGSPENHPVENSNEQSTRNLPLAVDSDTRKDTRWAFLRQTRSKFTLASRAAAVVEEEKNNVNNGREPKHIRKQTSLFSLGPLFNKHHQQNAKEPAPRVGSSKQYHHPPSPLAHSAAGNDDGRPQQCTPRKSVSSSNLLKRMSSWKIISQRILEAEETRHSKESSTNDSTFHSTNQNIQAAAAAPAYQISDLRFEPLDSWEESLIQALDNVHCGSSSIASRRAPLPTPPPLELPPSVLHTHGCGKIGLHDVEQFDAPSPILEKNERSTMSLHQQYQQHEHLTAPIEFKKMDHRLIEQHNTPSLLSAQLKSAVGAGDNKRMATKQKLEQAATRRQMLKFQQMREQADEAWLETLRLSAGGNVDWAHSETLFNTPSHHHHHHRPPIQLAISQENDTLDKSDVMLW